MAPDQNPPGTGGHSGKVHRAARPARPSLAPVSRAASGPVPPPHKSTAHVYKAAPKDGVRQPENTPQPGEDKPAAYAKITSPGGETLSKAYARTQRRRTRVLVAVLIPVFAIVLVVSLWQIFAIQFEYGAAEREYEDLRQQIFAPHSSAGGAVPNGAMQEEEKEEVLNLDAVVALNPECTGWIEIPNTSMSYPFVRGADNEKYLNQTFLGAQNSAGAIFMDYRNPANLSAPHMILYGHNMTNGSMFGLLPKYLDAAYLQAHPMLVLYNQEKTFTYQIFSARVSDAYDASYRVDFSGTEDLAAFAAAYGAPAGTSQMLTLSTCTNVLDEERILIHAALVSAA